MKKYLGLIVLALATNLFAIKNWNYYTNTTHIRDLQLFEDKIYLATWGGLAIYDLTNNAFEKTYTTISDLEDNDLRCLEFYSAKNQLLLGTFKKGINRFSNNDFAIPLNETLGLASNTVNEIVSKDSLIVAATENGISIFLDDENFPFPLLQNNYNVDDGLLTNSITSLQVSENGYIFCGSMLGLNYVHLDSLGISTAWHTANLPFFNNQVNSISIRNNLLAIGTAEGLAVSNFPNFDWEVYDDYGSIFPVFIDSNENIWFGTGNWNETDLLVEDLTDVAILQLQAGSDEMQSWMNEDLNLVDAQIMGFNETDNAIYAYSWGDGFLKLNHEKQTWTQYLQNCIGANLVTNMKLDQNNVLWISSGHRNVNETDRKTRGVSSFDGNYWEKYGTQNSEIISDNILSIAIDSTNRKWFGNWGHGISVFDDVSTSWNLINTTNTPGLSTNTISCIEASFDTTMWIGAYALNMSILNNNFEYIDNFELFDPTYNFSDFWKIHFAGNKIVFGAFYNGLRIWDNLSIPENDGNYWIVPPYELNDTQIFAIDSKNNDIWIASGKGLFMFDESDWFKYGTHIKKKVWKSGSWHDEATSEYWYFEGQERLYGGQTTYPTALFVDPFGIVWIGTEKAGITAYDVDKNIFTNYTMENSPLISNNITDFAYNSTNGILFIGTAEGLNSAQIGISEHMNFEENLNNTFCYPNPFYPENGEILKIDNTNAISMPKGDTKCNIYSLDGKLVRVLTKNNYQQFEWNGANATEQKCSSGLYFYVIYTNDSQTSNGKIVLIR